ncbi:MAG TPA: hypothetical protein P5080_02005 [Candidatus Paceibacterota bacterium]|nr:hypothetical protein [Candidatus Pacearchaeota archaeon]HRZ50637.1 hypothetical protein [Candidatus Paceibacterota bacterium]HSA36466.1 hypothetical protein [Candidatus Paceibacterota bacterium]
MDSMDKQATALDEPGIASIKLTVEEISILRAYFPNGLGICWKPELNEVVRQKLAVVDLGRNEPVVTFNLSVEEEASAYKLFPALLRMIARGLADNQVKLADAIGKLIAKELIAGVIYFPFRSLAALAYCFEGRDCPDGFLTTIEPQAKQAMLEKIEGILRIGGKDCLAWTDFGSGTNALRRMEALNAVMIYLISCLGVIAEKFDKCQAIKR